MRMVASTELKAVEVWPEREPKRPAIARRLVSALTL
jgi:hypothetical protein